VTRVRSYITIYYSHKCKVIMHPSSWSCHVSWSNHGLFCRYSGQCGTVWWFAS